MSEKFFIEDLNERIRSLEIENQHLKGALDEALLGPVKRLYELICQNERTKSQQAAIGTEELERSKTALISEKAKQVAPKVDQNDSFKVP